ncbi:LLM class flavin-dependent oxidoreductase [Croceivirga sp. JEA036]|uniref:LLM class flavin-dependent oxidoreductase n=1 Tax=Croceivirga sp. JEA036 TaxID=2721162 RepID=UPI001438DB43|nr:LLM class flavin-dependent oxidoreductase [Croceivirga sp. JEA036]NJB35526.1 LLM class flavin-dependent oxidoreductase [Croceivirga sp. JEA036]
MESLKYSVLDLVPITEGDTTKIALDKSLDLAQYAEQLGYTRFWVSEHHNTPSLASSATVVVLSHLAQGTKKIRIGSGGIMLPNHAPLVVAEQFGTLEALHPNRIDLALGRAPGTDQVTAHALRRGIQETVQDFPKEVAELQLFLSEDNWDSKVRAFPGEGANIPIFLLGSSNFSANLAAEQGLPYAFASHFAPTHLFSALHDYSLNFKSSKQCRTPYAMACVNVIAADTDEEAHYLATSFYQFAMGIITNVRRPLPPPVKSMDKLWTLEQEMIIKNMMHYTFIGSPSTIREQLQVFIEKTKIKELIVTTNIYDHEARKKSYTYSAAILQQMVMV